MSRANREVLTLRQREVIDWVKAFSRENGMPPTVRGIGGTFDRAPCPSAAGPAS